MLGGVGGGGGDDSVGRYAVSTTISDVVPVQESFVRDVEAVTQSNVEDA